VIGHSLVLLRTIVIDRAGMDHQPISRIIDYQFPSSRREKHQALSISIESPWHN
jgi:hypothetical protein